MEAKDMAFQAKELHGPYSVWDFGDRPQKLLDDIARAETGGRKAPVLPNEIRCPNPAQLAQGGLPPTMPPVPMPPRPPITTQLTSGTTQQAAKQRGQAAHRRGPRPGTPRLPRRGAAEGDRGRHPGRDLRPRRRQPDERDAEPGFQERSAHPAALAAGRRDRAEQSERSDALPAGGREHRARPQAGPDVRPRSEHDQRAGPVAAEDRRRRRLGQPDPGAERAQLPAWRTRT